MFFQGGFQGKILRLDCLQCAHCKKKWHALCRKVLKARAYTGSKKESAAERLAKTLTYVNVFACHYFTIIAQAHLLV